MSRTPIAALRRELGLTLEQFGAEIGLASKGNVSLIERGGRCSVKVALAIEALSKGKITAASLNTDVALVDSARRSFSRRRTRPEQERAA